MAVYSEHSSLLYMLRYAVWDQKPGTAVHKPQSTCHTPDDLQAMLDPADISALNEQLA